MDNSRVFLISALLFLCCLGTVQAAGTGTVYVTNATNVTEAGPGWVHLYLDNQFNPPAAAYSVQLTYDNTVIAYVDSVKKNATIINPVGNVIKINGFDVYGFPEGPVLLADLEFKAVADPSDGSSSPVSIKVNTVGDNTTADITASVSIRNGAVTTRDEVPPAVTISTPSTVSKAFTVAGTITDVGGMGTATATLTGLTSGHTEHVTLPLNPASGSTWTFSKGVTWTADYETVDINVTATDKAGNAGPKSKSVSIEPVGFSDQSPTGYVNTQPSVIKVFTQQMEHSSVALTLTGPATIPLGVTFSGDYAQNTSVPALADGSWTVTATGNDTSGNPHTYPWTFTKDTVPPVINSFTITDSDGDGYIEAGEPLTLKWNVADPNFVNVSLVDTATGDVLWTDSSSSGTATKTIAVGNRDLEFRAYDSAGNSASRSFHLYYNYMAWVNSTKVGTVSGIDTNLSSMRQFDLTDQGYVTFYNACPVPFIPLGTINRSVTSVGQVTGDTFVAVDNTANATYTGADTYNKVWAYDPGRTLDFLVQAPNINAANLLIMEANESYLAQLANEGKSARDHITYSDLIQKSAWIFIDGGYTKIKVNSDGTFTQDVVEGNPLTAHANIIDTLRDSANQVNLATAGYRLNAQSLPAITLPAGDYALVAVSMDGDRIGVIDGMPFAVMDSAAVGTVPASVTRGTSFNASFPFEAERLGVVAIRKATWDAQVGVNASTLGTDSLSVNLTYGGVPATKKLYGNVYASPDAAKYAYARNASSVSVATDGILEGTYAVYMVAESENGTVLAYGYHEIAVQNPGTPAANFTASPMTGFTPLTVNFTDTSTGSIDSRFWDFGDGTNSTEQNPTHVFTSVGTYTVNLTVTGYGGSNTMSKQIIVTSPVPVANFTASPTSGSVPLNVTFTDLSTGNITSRFWDFGDGTNSTARSPYHIYNTTGIFTANLTVTGPLGNDSAVANITVNAAPTPTPTSSPSHHGGSSGGGNSVSTTTSTGSATLLTASWGGVLTPYRINTDTGDANLYIATGVTALVDGEPVDTIRIADLSAGDIPKVPTGVTYSFLNYAVECGPAGATFSPAIKLTFTPTDEEWAEILEKVGGKVENLAVKWYNPSTGDWEYVPTTVDATQHTVTASIAHFSTYGLFSDAAVVTPVTQETTSPVTPVTSATTVTTTTTVPAPSGEGGFPWLWVVLIIVIIAVAVGAYAYMQRR